jgi:amino acid transporter
VQERSGLIRGLGPIATTALVVGNIIGSGIYVIPASLAEIAGPVSLLAWAVVAVGYACLAMVYTDLASAYPVTGGLQVYVGRAFGKLWNLETGFLYWTSCVTGNAPSSPPSSATSRSWCPHPPRRWSRS